MAHTWVIVADSSRARLFSMDSARGPLHEFEFHDHPAGRAHVQDLTTDLPGRSFNRVGQGRHALETAIDPKTKEGMDFSKNLARRLGQARNSGDFEHLVLIAAPEFLGYLRRELNSHTQKCVSREISKDLVAADAKELHRYVTELKDA